MKLNEYSQQFKHNEGSAVQYAIRQALLALNTCIPAKIVEVNGNRCTLSLLIDKVTIEGEVVDTGYVFNVPIYQVSALGASIYIPIPAGSLGYLICTQRDQSATVDTLKKGVPSNGEIMPLQGFFLPMQTIDKNLTPQDANAICVEYGNTNITLKDAEVNIKSEKVNIDATTCNITSDDVTIDASNCEITSDTANITASIVNLGGEGGLGVARIGDAVTTPAGPGTITGGSTSVFAK